MQYLCDRNDPPAHAEPKLNADEGRGPSTASDPAATLLTQTTTVAREHDQFVELFVTRVLLPGGDVELIRETVDRHVLDESLRARLTALLQPQPDETLDAVVEDAPIAASAALRSRLTRWYTWLR